ncbi:MAG: ribonuclease HI [Campylobacterales bacterium]|nr:ribonuclease HI [Campylobacterales bacterium]
MQKQQRKTITLYSDGSSLGNPGPGGYGGILEFQGHCKHFSGGEAHTTNNRMELMGVIEGLKLIKEPCNVIIISDSSYVVNAINKWLPGWIAKNFAKVKNVDLWKMYIDASAPHTISAQWVRGHNGHIENELCDQMAKAEAMKFKEWL